MIRKHIGIAVCLVAVMATSLVQAAECDPDVESTLDQMREQYINGMSGLANNNASMRPGSYSQMSCLDSFMQGDMDIFFRPPKLDDLLQQALSFACEQIAGALEGGGPGGQGGQGQVLDLMKSFSGGLNVPNPNGGGSMQVNIQDFVKMPEFNSGSSQMSDIFAGVM